MEEVFITITGIDYYLGKKPFKVGRKVRLVKEEENEYDAEAIRVELPYIDTVGYVANSTHTVYDGTLSAGRIYEKIGEKAVAQVMFITHSAVIAKVLSENSEKVFENEEL
ncbi:MAG: HIRAN domain-containing protein [Clostridia bacterium]|nr:HIRAN domain-containing protein [Clostridia bacterium]